MDGSWDRFQEQGLGFCLCWPGPNHWISMKDIVLDNLWRRNGFCLVLKFIFINSRLGLTKTEIYKWYLPHSVPGWVATFLPKPWFDKLCFIMIIFLKTCGGLSLLTFSSKRASIEIRRPYCHLTDIWKKT